MRAITFPWKGQYWFGADQIWAYEEVPNLTGGWTVCTVCERPRRFEPWYACGDCWGLSDQYCKNYSAHNRCNDCTEGDD